MALLRRPSVPIRRALSRCHPPRPWGHDVVAPALPTEELGTTWQDYADEILDAVGSRMEEAVLVGHSLGAVPVAIAASRAAPRLVVYPTPSTPARDLPKIGAATFSTPRTR